MNVTQAIDSLASYIQCVLRHVKLSRPAQADILFMNTQWILYARKQKLQVKISLGGMGLTYEETTHDTTVKDSAHQCPPVFLLLSIGLKF